MINEASEGQLKSALDAMVEEGNLERLRSEEKLQRQRLENFSLHKEDFQTVKVQLRALGLIAKSEKPRSVKDSGTYWTLTPYGDEVMIRLRAIRSNQASEPADEGTREGGDDE
jgi:DNA-binding PadR family transcriptional regulator